MQAIQMAQFTLLPSVLVSGAIFERSLMPVPMQLLAYIFPLTYYIDIVRGILLRGAGLAELWPSVVPMLAYSVIGIICASFIFARTTR